MATKTINCLTLLNQNYYLDIECPREIFNFELSHAKNVYYVEQVRRNLAFPATMCSHLT